MILFFILIGIVLLGVLLLVVFRFRKKRFTENDRRFFHGHWVSVTDLVRQDPKRAILEADKLLDWALRKHGYEGSVADKLKKAGKLFSHVDAVWKAHKLRNRIAHELEIKISIQEGEEALRGFQTAFRDLGL